MAKNIAGELVQINYHEDGKPHRVKSVWQNQDGVLVEFVPVVRCEDCIYSGEAKVNQKGFLICPASGMEITDMDFCSYGDRRADNGEE